MNDTVEGGEGDNLVVQAPVETKPARKAGERFPMLALVVGVAAGLAGGWVASQYSISRYDDQLRQDMAALAPLVVFDTTAYAQQVISRGASQDMAIIQARESLGRLRDLGYVVLDANAVLIAPNQLYVGGPPQPKDAGARTLGPAAPMPMVQAAPGQVVPQLPPGMAPPGPPRGQQPQGQPSGANSLAVTGPGSPVNGFTVGR